MRYLLRIAVWQFFVAIENANGIVDIHETLTGANPFRRHMAVFVSQRAKDIEFALRFRGHGDMRTFTGIGEITMTIPEQAGDT